MLPGIDGRSLWHRRCRDLIEGLNLDLGGEDCLSLQQQILIRRVSVIVIELEALELKFAINSGAEGGDLDLYQRTTTTLRRTLEALGLKRVPRDVTPTSLRSRLMQSAEAA